jgi:transcriptional antiterminator NusG
MPWYVIQTYSGHEKKVKAHLEERVRAEGKVDEILEVRIPTQRIAEVKDGRRRTIERSVYPGYVFLSVADSMTDTTGLLPFVRQTPGVMGFVPSRNEPTPLSEKDVPSMVEAEEVEEPETVTHIEYDVGDVVRVIEGPFAGFTGEVNDVDMQKQKLKLTISIFGRATPVELDFLQVERV